MNRCARCSGELPAFAVFCPHCAQAHEPDFDQLINLTIDGRYRIYRRLGRGGLSTIFAATDLDTDNVVAVKISDPAQLVHREMSYAIDGSQTRDYWDEMLERMRREAETLTHLDHPNIVRFYGTGLINEDLRYVAMEFLRGRTLRDEMDRGGSVEQSRAINITLEITSALSEVHSRGIVHRDINPRNIFMCGDDVKLIDFGIAKFPQPPGAPPFTQHSTLAGTVAYASPEQCASHPVDHRSDIYSLGVVLYEMVTGQRPFNGRTPTEIALKQIQSAPEPPRSINQAISVSLERTIQRALAKNPIERQQSVEALREELRGSSNQIFIPLAAATPDEVDPSEITLSRNGITDFDESGEMAESHLKLVRRRRRRFVMTTAAMLTVAATSVLLFGWPAISSRLKSADLLGNNDAAASSSPAAVPVIGSDADSLELDANMSSRNNGGAASSPKVTSQAAPNSIQPPQPANSVATDTVANNKASARTAIPPTPSPAPSPIPPKARPQMPPAPAPAIEIARAPQPDSEPDISQAPVKEQESDEWRRETDTANNSNRGPNGSVTRDSDRDDDHGLNRDRNSRAGDYRRPPDSPNRDDRDDDEEDFSDRYEPKLIQWSGRVNREREITIEMPGGPGAIDIPRRYRDRVGIVEPPSANNNWRCAVLRVFGRGGVSIVVRWWPAARNAARFTARR